MGRASGLLVLGICMIMSACTVHGSQVTKLQNGLFPEKNAFSPSTSYQQNTRTWNNGFVSFVEILRYKYQHHWSPSPAPSYVLTSQTHHQQGMASASTISQFPYHNSPSGSLITPTPAVSPSNHEWPVSAPSPMVNPISSNSKKSSPPMITALPPPPPNEDCSSLTCPDPLTNSIVGYACACVWPIQVELHLGVSLYTFFPLVSRLASEIATSLSLKQSQVHITGADMANEQQDQTVVLLNLVPLGSQFNSLDAMSIYEQFWREEVQIDPSHFGRYQVIYVNYPGLPSSPPPVSSTSGLASDPYASNDYHGNLPVAVNIPQRQNKGLGRSLIAVIVLSSFIALIACIGICWLLISKCKCTEFSYRESASSISSIVPPGTGKSILFGSTASTASLSLQSSLLTLAGSAKVFSLYDLERATNGFDASGVLGEGGFGVVYGGVLDDGQKVAVKVLKRGDNQGGPEFLAEVEMLSRLHHRNLVKLIGICAEDLIRCIVYELIPNGSVESHLHGPDKCLSPLDWGARMKIALGAAKGLSYLHEDSSPCVIHCDFKASNILLEHDFTPKVSDFGLAKAALNVENQLTSTQVMGTFGYVAPEYAMTGHLLAKSDVYSYGVVLLELLTGRKPVDLSKPSGQENLVSWARPLLSSKEGLEAIMDPALEQTIIFDIFSKVAAIASMCVQPEASRRPVMGEVVQALRLVCDEFDDPRNDESRSSHQAEMFIDLDSNISENSGEFTHFSPIHHPMLDYGSSPDSLVAFSTSDWITTSAGLREQEYPSFDRPFKSGPLKFGKRKEFWQRINVLSGGSVSEHGCPYNRWSGSP